LFVLMPQFGRLFDAHAYGTAFVLAALCPALGYLCLQRLATIPKEPLALEPEFE
jgi:hypothetical protein